ncbi:hypothetical protein ACFYYH_23925 [Streptomyces sp. NPDC002018]|uniref:hypothetical protein n=1 Tax=Streptomyces sp. NPDC002018 TaxID=3364629 RepID=UPI003684DD01
MSRRHRLRLAVLTAVAAGTMLAPVSAAVASDRTPAPSAPAAQRPTTADETADRKRAEAAKATAARRAEAAKRAAIADTAPRGGVAAGEAPAGNTGITTLVGPVTGALLLAGAGTFVLRRRAAERRDG